MIVFTLEATTVMDSLCSKKKKKEGVVAGTSLR